MDKYSIETVPKDGTLVILYTKNSDPVIAAWKESFYWLNGKKNSGPRYGWVTAMHNEVNEEFNVYFKPTHWAHVP